MTIADVAGIAVFAGRTLHEDALQVLDEASCEGPLANPGEGVLGSHDVVQDLPQIEGELRSFFQIRFQDVLKGCVSPFERACTLCLTPQRRLAQERWSRDLARSLVQPPKSCLRLSD